jgi:hypothetical protein
MITWAWWAMTAKRLVRHSRRCFTRSLRLFEGWRLSADYDTRRIGGSCVQNGSVMSGRAPADQGLFFGVALVVGAVMSSASHEGSSVNSFLPMAIRGELSFPQGIPC